MAEDVPTPPLRMDRRRAIAWMVAAAASAALTDSRAFGGGQRSADGQAIVDGREPVHGRAPVDGQGPSDGQAPGVGQTPADGRAPGNTPAEPRHGYGQDPDLLRDYKPGDLWPLTFTEHQRRTAAALCDTILPEDDRSPAASTLGVHDFIDEWISAPYPGHAKDRRLVLEGFAWLDAESQRRYTADFATLSTDRRDQISQDICRPAAAAPPFQEPSTFFNRFRDLASGGFYTTAEGMKDLGYVGNIPSGAFAGPPPEVLRRLGL